MNLTKLANSYFQVVFFGGGVVVYIVTCGPMGHLLPGLKYLFNPCA
jgi:hypothetical protein